MRIFVWMLLSLHTTTMSLAQHIFIGKEENNRPLTWNEFQGFTSQNYRFLANTVTHTGYKASKIKIQGNNVTIDSIEAWVTFDIKKSWVKKEGMTEELLIHEQGHFDLYKIGMYELLIDLKAVQYTIDYKSQMQTIYAKNRDKYAFLNRRYDIETEHGQNIEVQDKWNSWISEQLLKSPLSVSK